MRKWFLNLCGVLVCSSLVSGTAVGAQEIEYSGKANVINYGEIRLKDFKSEWNDSTHLLKLREFTVEPWWTASNPLIFLYSLRLGTPHRAYSLVSKHDKIRKQLSKLPVINPRKRVPKLSPLLEIDRIFQAGDDLESITGVDIEEAKHQPEHLNNWMNRHFPSKENSEDKIDHSITDEASVKLLSDFAVDLSPSPAGLFSNGFKSSAPPAVPYLGVRNARAFKQFGGNLPRNTCDTILPTEYYPFHSE